MNTLSKQALEFSLYALIMQVDDYNKRIAEVQAKIDSPEYNDIKKYYFAKDVEKMQQTLAGLELAKAEIKAIL